MRSLNTLLCCAYFCLVLFFSAPAHGGRAWRDSVVDTVKYECSGAYEAASGGSTATPGKSYPATLDEKGKELFYLLTHLRKISEDAGTEKTVSDAVIAKFKKAIVEGKPIKMYIPCFPAKSPNHVKKTLGDHPDLAEEIALARLQAVVEAMNKIHPTELVIASDGRIFADTWWSTDAKVDEYRKGMVGMIKVPQLKMNDLNDFFPGLTPQQARDKIMAEYAPSVEEVRHDIETNPERKALYLAFTRFIDGDTPPDDPALVGLSSNGRKKLNKERAIEDIRRSDALNKFLIERLVNQEGYIRLSIRDSVDTPEKLGINLLENEGGEFAASPWHSVIAIRLDGTYQVMKREDAEKAGYQLVHENGRPHHFEEVAKPK